MNTSKEIEKPMRQDSQYKYRENNPTYKGEQLDRNLVHGPIEERHCTDILMLLLFIAFQAGMVIISIVAFSEGNPEILISPFDSDGNQCGISPGYENFKNIYSYKVGSQYQYVCSDSCPHKNGQGLITAPQYKSIKSGNITQLPLYDSIQLVRTCVPKERGQQSQFSSESLPSDSIQEYMNDIKEAWGIELGSVFIALTFGYIYLFMMKYLSGCMVWSCIVLVEGFLTAFGLIFYNNDTTFGQISSASQSDQRAIGIIMLIVAAILLLYLICNCKKIQLAIAIMKCASQYSADVPTSFLVPLLMFFFYVLYLLYWVYSALYIYSSGEIKKSNSPTPYGQIKWNTSLKQCLVYAFFNLLWNSSFFSAFSYFIIASSTCLWYFSQCLQNQPKNLIFKSVCRGFIHIGSLCFGALIITIVWLISIVFELIRRCVEDHRGSKSNLQTKNKCHLCCIQCCVSCAECYEGFMRFINKLAYIQIALQGKGFCQSSSQAFYLTLRHAKTYAAVSGIEGLIIFFGKLFVCTISTLICYAVITTDSTYKVMIFSPIFPTIYIAIATYFIGSIFMSVFGTSIDTILQCFCVDTEVHQELNEGPKYVPSTLKEFLDVSAKSSKK